jgi:hypothetical protein
MELLIPSLAALLLAVAIAYFVMPNYAPPVLIGAGVILLVVAEYIHWSQFGVSEYERATWQYNLRKYGSYVIIGAVLLGAYGFYTMNQSGSSMATPALPAVAAPTAMAGGMNGVAKTVTSRIQELMRRGRISLD